MKTQNVQKIEFYENTLQDKHFIYACVNTSCAELLPQTTQKYFLFKKYAETLLKYVL